MSAISVPAVIVNNIGINIKPNSLMFNDGLPESKIRTASGGGAATETIFTNDIETAFSEVKFVLYTTSENIERVRAWKTNEQQNIVKVTDKSGFTRSMSNAAIINKPQYETGVEGEVEVEFHGDPLA